MKYLDVGCRINCWECNEDCNIKKLIKLSISNNSIEKVYYSCIIDALKIVAGIELTKGKDFEIIQEDFKEIAVSFYVARLKFIEENQD